MILNQAVQTSSSSGSGAFVILAIVIIVFLKIISSALKEKPQKRPVPRNLNGTSPSRRNGSRVRIYYPTANDIQNFNPHDLRIFGIPGKGLNDASNFSESNVKSGIEGEVKTASIVDKFVAKSTNCYVFHSMKWPLSSTQADVDHIIVCGENVLLLDSKNWKQKGLYAFDWEGNITVDGKSYYFGKQPKIVNAREKYQDYIKEIFGDYHAVEVSSVVIIHNDSSSVGPGAYGRFNHLVTGADLESFLREWELTCGIVEDDKKLLCAIHSLLK